jgi:hypothetical protein
MNKIRLHLDADTSIKALHKELIARGHDVTRTPTDWIAMDETKQMRCIFTFNIRDFIILAQKYLEHWGIILAAQKKWSLSQLIQELDLFLAHTYDIEMKEQVRWLNK